MRNSTTQSVLVPPALSATPQQREVFGLFDRCEAKCRPMGVDAVLLTDAYNGYGGQQAEEVGQLGEDRQIEGSPAASKPHGASGLEC